MPPETGLFRDAALGEIAPHYDALLCDVWGVVHDGRRPFADACAALARFRAERGPVVLITNSPRPSSEIPAQFRRIGVPEGLCDAIITSGDVTRAELARRAGQRVHKIGPERDTPIYAGLDLIESSIETADFISCTGLDDEYAETPDDYRGLLRAAAGRGLPMVCANPDLVVHVGDVLIPCAGALAAVHGEYGGEVVMAGKPYPPIYDLALRRLREITDRDIPPARLLAIGDGVPTDIAGANAAGIDALFIADGVHRDAPGGAAAALAAAGAQARYTAGRLVW